MVQFINLFEVPADRESEFLELFEQVHAYIRVKPGYQGHYLYRAVQAGQQFRFVNYAEWDSAEHFQAAHDEGFRTLVTRPAWLPFRSTPALYEIVMQDHR